MTTKDGDKLVKERQHELDKRARLAIAKKKILEDRLNGK